MEDIINILITDFNLFFDILTFNCWLDGKKIEETLQIKLLSYNINLKGNLSLNSIGNTLNSSNSFNLPLNSTLGSTLNVWNNSTTNSNNSTPLNSSLNNNLNTFNSLNFNENEIIYEYLKEEINDLYNSFEILEHYLRRPMLLSCQYIIQFNDNIIKEIIEKYYELNDVIVRELLNKRFSKNRKDLDDIAESCKLPVIRVRRQFDNLKNISSMIEEYKQFQCNILSFIEVNFVLP